MLFKKKFVLLSSLIALGLLILPQAGITAENTTLRDIGIANFSNDTGNPDLDRYTQSIPDTIFTRLAGSQKLSLVERSRLEDAFNEMGLAEVGIVDPDTAAKVGNIVGARNLFVGRIFEEGGVIRINTRLINVKESNVVAGWTEGVTTSQLSEVAPRIADRILKQLFPSSPGSAALKSAVIPGWGQLSNDRVSGYIFLPASVLSLAGLIGTSASLSSAEDDQQDAKDKLAVGERVDAITQRQLIELRKAARDAREKVDDKRSQRNITAIVLGTVWGLNIIDAYIETSMLRKSRQTAVQQTLSFEATPNLQGIVMRVRF